ncbi:Uncharacterised protein [Mycobacterium tuberculosis]|nr:Uncharacterised protein [Mycobacterium tuberculosis]
MVAAAKCPHRVGAHPPRRVWGGAGDDLRADAGHLVSRRSRTRIHHSGEHFRSRGRLGARRVRTDPASVRCLLGGRRTHVGRRRLCRSGRRGAVDHGPTPADLLPAGSARRQLGGAANHPDRRIGLDVAVGGGGAAQGQGLDRVAWHVRCRAVGRRRSPAVASARSRGPGGATPATRKRCAVRYSGNGHGAARWCGSSCDCNT